MVIFWVLLVQLVLRFPVDVSCDDYLYNEEADEEVEPYPDAPYRSYFQQNKHKFIGALKIFHNRILKKDGETDLRLPPEPWSLLGAPCNYSFWQSLVGTFVTSGEPVQDYLGRLSDAPYLQGSCLTSRSVPLLECDNVTLTCSCQKANFTPYDFAPRSPGHVPLIKECLAKRGSICDGWLEKPGTVNCAPGLKCKTEAGGVCGGMFSLLENSFAGQEIVFTPYQLLQASETEGRVDSLLIDIQTHTTLPVGTSCDHLGWKKIAEPYLALLDAVSEDGSAFPTALAAIENMGENETREATLIWEGLRRSTQRCLDHFPIMICQKARNLGEKDTCVCGNNKAPFNYSMESDGACAGTLGSVCTSMHGPVHCVEDPDVDVACIPYKTSHPQHTELPSTLTVFDLKVCGEQRVFNTSGNVTGRKRSSAQRSSQVSVLKMMLLLLVTPLFI